MGPYGAMGPSLVCAVLSRPRGLTGDDERTLICVPELIIEGPNALALDSRSGRSKGRRRW